MRSFARAAAFAAFFFAAPASAEPLKSLAKSLAKGLSGEANRKIAVLSFPGHDGVSGPGSAVIQERLTTYLAQTGKAELIERRRLEAVLEEMKLSSSGMVDEATAQKLGKLLGAGAVVTGSLHDLPDGRAEVNARLVQTETARILSAKLVRVKKDWGSAAVLRPAPRQPAGESLSQIALLLDTSSSMDGLIEQAKSQLWRVVNELSRSKEGGSGAEVEVALYEYGNNSLDAGSGYIRRLSPFTKDLDGVFESLSALKTNGGSEFAGMAIARAVSDLEWSKKDDVYKAVFIAGNEAFSQGPVDYRRSAADAKARGIFVNTIFCGPRQQGIASSWEDGAVAAGGDFFAIDQDRFASAPRAPQDDEIARLGRELSSTYVPLGAMGEAAKSRQMSANAAAASRGSAGAAVERSLFMAQKQYGAAAASWDAVELGAKALPESELPEELKALNEKERAAYLKEKKETRVRIEERLRQLGEQRREFLEKGGDKTPPAAGSLDAAMVGAVRRQARL